MILKRKLLLGVLIAVLVTGCAAPRPVQPQQAAIAATPTRVQRPTRAPQTAAPEPTATATVVASPTTAPTAVPQTAVPQMATAPATVTPPSGAAAPANLSTAPTTGGKGSGVVLALNSRKYPAPTLLTPDNNAIYHVAQPVVRMAWSAIPTDLMTFGQTPGCVSDATNFRRAFESYQFVIHSLDAARTDQVQWTENSPEFYFNLTTAPQGRYSWSVSVVTLCESYVAGQRAKTITRSLVGPASPVSASRTFNWIP